MATFLSHTNLLPQSRLILSSGRTLERQSLNLLNQRELLILAALRVNPSQLLDAKIVLKDEQSFNQLSVREMLRYKYQIDVDGEVNAW